MASTVINRPASLKLPPSGDLFSIIAFLVLFVPTLFGLADQTWSRDFGAYGPIVLVTGGWLLWRQIPDMRVSARLGNPWITAAILSMALLFYIFGAAYDFISLQSAGVYGVGLSMLYARVGWRVVIRHWFPLLYLAFAVPPPSSFLADVTSPLKQLVSLAATDWLHAFGVPVSRQGVTIFVAQYQLLVEDACSGMNSIVGLIAVSLLYIHLARGSSILYSIVLAVFVIPVAIVANIIRIMVLVLLTYFFGNEVGQGFLHFTAGMFLFVTALIFVFGLDKLLSYGQARFLRSRP